MSLEDLFEYMAKGALVIIFFGSIAVLLAPFVLGYIIAVILWKLASFFYWKLMDIYYFFWYRLLRPKPKAKVDFPVLEPVEARPFEEETKEPEPEPPPQEEPAQATEEKQPEPEEEQEENEGWTDETPEPEPEPGFYVERELKHEEKEKLFAKGYKRLKISPYGTSGAAYYWVKPRYNESKEHAFFCYLVEAEVKKYAKELKTNVTYGPDVEFEAYGRKYCVDVETGTNTERNPAFLNKKFAYYNKEFARVFILVTNKKLKYSYKRFGTVLTRSTFRKAIEELFQ